MMTDANRYQEAMFLSSRALMMATSHWAGNTVRGDRLWEKREEFSLKFSELVREYWEEYKPTPAEQKEIDNAINSW